MTLRQSTSNDTLQNKSFTVEITEKLVHQSPQGNMQELFDCIRLLLKRFLTWLTFHRKEIRLHHLHKRTNPGSAPDKNLLKVNNRTPVQGMKTVKRYQQRHQNDVETYSGGFVANPKRAPQTFPVLYCSTSNRQMLVMLTSCKESEI